jgi:septum formation protein
MKLILASGSEWRKELLSWLELPFVVVESGVDETGFPDEEPSELVARLATLKAHEVARKRQATSNKPQEEEDTLIIGADTVVVVEDSIVGKPKDRKHAQEIIGQLSGKTHEVWTGVCVIDPVTGERRVEVEVTRVTMRHITDRELKKYLDTNEWVGKAGGYQVQGSIRDYITDLEGSYTNVIGLPLLIIQDFLESLGVMVEVDVVEEIRKRTGRES